MKIFFLTLALLMAGLVFVAPPLIAFLPALVVGVLLMASPLIMRSMTRVDRGGRARAEDSGVRRDQRPTPGTTVRWDARAATRGHVLNGPGEISASRATACSPVTCPLVSRRRIAAGNDAVK